MATYALKFYEITGIGSGKPIHDGTDNQGYPALVTGFTLQAKGADLLVTDEDAVSSDIGITVAQDNAAGWGDVESRGSEVSFDLRQIYVKGTGTAVIALEVQAD